MASGDGKYARALSEEVLGITDEDIAVMTYDEAIATPRIKESAGLIRMWWDADQVQVAVSRLHAHKDGRVTGELKITTSAPGYRPHLHQAQLNFIATNSKASLAKHLEQQMNGVDWPTIIEQISCCVLDRMRQGEPVIDLWSNAEMTAPGYILHPLLPERMPTVIYGLGGTGKSLLCLALAVCAQLPWEDNPLGLQVTKRTPVMYLDWEMDSEDVNWRLASLQRGMGFPIVSVPYRRFACALADDMERIQQMILERDVGLVIVDSIGAACGGDLEKPEPAIRMYTALRQLKVASCLIAHTPKNQQGKESTIFGSAFFNFYARSVWEIKKVQENDDNHFTVGLFHRKANVSKLYKPLGFRIDYDEQKNAASIKRTNLANVEEFASHLPLAQQIRNLVGRQGKMQVDAIAECTGKKVDQVRARLNDMKRAGVMYDFGKDGWGLAE